MGNTIKYIAKPFRDNPTPTGFVRSFFPSIETGSRLISVPVQRGSERVAVDISRGADANMNTFGKSSEVIKDIPYFSEKFNATELDIYERLVYSKYADERMYESFRNELASKMVALRAKIERAYEVQATELLNVGTVTTTKLGVIDFKRKAGSMVDLGAGQYFASAIDPFPKFKAGCDWIRTNGFSGAVEFNCILGDTAFDDLLNNAKFQARQDLVSMKLDAVNIASRSQNGSAYFGTISAGPYKVNLWTYPQYYQNNSGTSIPYIDPKKCILIAGDVEANLFFGAVPQLLSEPGTQQDTSAYVLRDYKDEKYKTHEFFVESCGLPVLISLDKVYTFKAVA